MQYSTTKTTTTLQHTLQFYCLSAGLGRADCIFVGGVDGINFFVQHNFKPKIS